MLLCLQQEWRFRAAAHIQSVYRGYIVRRDLKWQIYYATKIQRLFRSWSRHRALMLRVFTLAQRKRFKNVIQIQSLCKWVQSRSRIVFEFDWAAIASSGSCGHPLKSLWFYPPRLHQ